MIPTINIIAKNVFECIDNRTYNNWWIQFLFINVGLIFYAVHYVLAVIMPVLLYKRKKEFDIRSGLFAVSAVLMANLVMVVFSMRGAGLNRFPNYMIRPVCVTMAAVIIVSILIMVRERRGRETGKNSIS